MMAASTEAGLRAFGNGTVGVEAGRARAPAAEVGEHGG